MNSNIGRLKLYNSVESLGEALEIITGQSCDKIYVDIAYADLLRDTVSLEEIGAVVFSAYFLKYLIVKRLRIYTYSGNAKLLGNLELFSRNSIGAACLEGKLKQGGYVNLLVYLGKQAS